VSLPYGFLRPFRSRFTLAMLLWAPLVWLIGSPNVHVFLLEGFYPAALFLSFLTKCKSAGQQQEPGVANHAVLWSYSKTIQMPAALYSFGGVCRRETAVITDRFVEARWFGRGGHIVDPHAIGRQ